MENLKKTVEKNKRYTRSGVLFYDVPVAPVDCVMRYSYQELSQENPGNNGFKEGDVIRVYRPKNFFSQPSSILNNAITTPLTNNHPGRMHGNMVSRDNPEERIGHGINPYIKNNILFYKTVDLYDNDAIEDYESGKKELSIGYLPAQGMWIEVEQRKKLGYDLIEAIQEINHFSLVDAGRAGKKYRLHEQITIEDNSMPSLDDRVIKLEESLTNMNDKIDKTLLGVTAIINSKEDEDKMKKDKMKKDESKEKDEDKMKKDESKEKDEDKMKKDESKEKDEDMTTDESEKTKSELKESRKNEKLLSQEIDSLKDELELAKMDKEDAVRQNDVFIADNKTMAKLFASIPSTQLAYFVDNDKFSNKEKIQMRKYGTKVSGALEKKTKGVEEKASRLNDEGATTNISLPSVINGF